MPLTRRRTNKTPPYKMMARMFNTVPKYLDWIMHSSAKVGKNERENRLRNEGILCTILGSMLVKACRENPKVEKYFHIGDITPMKHAVRELLVKESPEEYTLRFYLRHLGPQGTYQMQTGYPYNTAKGSAMLCLHESLTIMERQTMHRLMEPCLEGIYISPSKMASWLVPVMVKSIKRLNKKVICGHSIRTLVLHSKDGLSVLIVCTSKADRKSFTAKVNFDIGVEIPQLPKYYNIPHPYPKYIRAFVQKGRELVKDIKMGFENGQHCVCLRYAMVKKQNGMILPTLGPRSKTMISGLNVNLIERDLDYTLKSNSLNAFADVTSERDKNLWMIDYNDLEKHIASTVKHQASFRCIQEAFRLYNVLSNCGGKVLPPLSQDAKRSLSLWLYKQSDHGFEDMMSAFTALLELSGACIQNGFCPSFCNPNLNTMAGMLRDEEYEEEREEGDNSDVISESLGSEMSSGKVKEENNVLKLFGIIEQDDVQMALELLKIC